MDDIILITADSLRFDYISYFNQDSPADTPNIDRLAEEGSAYHTAIANGPGTVASVPSLITGEYKPSVEDTTPTIAEELSKVGYKTAAFCPNVQIVGPHLSHMELDRGFDHFDTLLDAVRERSEYTVEKAAHGVGYVSNELFGEGRIHNTIASIVSYLPLPLARPAPSAEVVNSSALEWLNDEVSEDEPYFMWLFYLDTHEPWLPPEEFLPDEYTGTISRHRTRGLNRKFRYFKHSISDKELEKIRDLYTASVEYWDQKVGQIVEEIRESREEDPTIILTSDHGELFGEHGEVSHGNSPWEPLIRVPLVINGPGFDSVDISAPVQNIDISNTIGDVAHADIPETFRGLSLVDRTKDNKFDRKGVCSIIDEDPSEVVYHTGDWKYINREGGKSRLYKIEPLLKESRVVSAEHSDLVDQIEEELNKQIGHIDFHGEPKSTQSSEEIEERLRSLGYIDD